MTKKILYRNSRRFFAASAFALVSAVLLTLTLSACGDSVDSLAATKSSYPEVFHTSGNQIVSAQDTPVVFRGFNPVDPLWQDGGEDLAVGAFQELTYSKMGEWGANIVRIPIYPATWRRYGDTKLFEVLDQTLTWMAASELYAIIDFHSIGYPPEEDYQSEPDLVFGELYFTSRAEIYTFWRLISTRYSGDNRVVAYELFNEPARNSAQGFPATNTLNDWLIWKTFLESVIDTIRLNDPNKIVMAGGFQFAYDLAYVANNPILDNNLVYTVHPYPDANWRITWDSAFGNVAATVPVFASEFGFDTTLKLETDYQESGRYRDAIMAYLNTRNIGWTVWSSSDGFPPALLADTSFTPSESGRFFRNAISSASQP